MRVACFVAVGLVASGSPARAGEPADRGVSLTAWAGAALDRSVSFVDGDRPLHDGAPLIGVTGLGNIGPLALGGTVDATPRVHGDSRLSIAALVGFQPEVVRLRLQFLGEAGRHRFSDVGGNALAHQLGPDTWLPYLGVRIGVARTVPRHGVFELGAWLFWRQDIGQTTVTNMGGPLGVEPPTDYRVGGWMSGLALQVGLRLESSNPHRWEEFPATR